MHALCAFSDRAASLRLGVLIERGSSVCIPESDIAQNCSCFVMLWWCWLLVCLLWSGVMCLQGHPRRWWLFMFMFRCALQRVVERHLCGERCPRCCDRIGMDHSHKKCFFLHHRHCSQQQKNEDERRRAYRWGIGPPGLVSACTPNRGRTHEPAKRKANPPNTPSALQSKKYQNGGRRQTARRRFLPPAAAGAFLFCCFGSRRGRATCDMARGTQLKHPH